MLKKLVSIKMALKFIDIGANLTDPMFRGVYGGSLKHNNDFEHMLQRAWAHGLQKIIITVGSLSEADEALAMAAKDERFFVTIGCHPTRCDEFLADPSNYYEQLRKKIAEYSGKVVAVGECGLDYDRLHFCQKETQKIYFEKQLSLAAEFGLPLFLHCRNSHEDFMEILNRNREKIKACGGGVVHSFDGTLEEAESVLSFGGLYIGLNGCSLKTKDNLEVVRRIPNDKILLETDSPWCGIRASHAGYHLVQTKFNVVKKKVKWASDTLIEGRNEPCQIKQVLEVIAGAKDEPAEKLAEIFYENTLNLFFKKETTN